MRDFLALIGLAASATVLFTIVCLFFASVKELIIKLKWRYKYKHRFDKPPTAKCYCKDCKRHGDETGRCYKFDRWHTADNWFCWDAEPREKEPKEET